MPLGGKARATSECQGSAVTALFRHQARRGFGHAGFL
jgi:hypothetical protein